MNKEKETFLNAFWETLKKAFSNDKTDVKLQLDAKTSDGVIVRTDGEDFANGGQLLIVNADGTMTPATDGDYTLEDGRVVTCAGGVITNVVASTDMNAQPKTPVQQKSDEKDKAKDNQMEKDKQEIKFKAEDSYKELIVELEKVKEKFDSATKKIEKLEKEVAENSQINVQLKELVNKIGESSADEPKNLKKTDVKLNEQKLDKKRPSSIVNEFFRK
jgi:hypothetical protein